MFLLLYIKGWWDAMSVQKKGKYFYSVLSYKDKGVFKQKWIKLDSKSEDEAITEESLLKIKTAYGVPNKSELKKIKFSKLIEDQLEEYEIRIKENKITGFTVETYQNWINKYIEPFFGDIPLVAVNAMKIREFQKYLLNKDLSVRTIRKIFVPLREIIDRGVEIEAIPYNFARNIKFEKPSVNEIKKNIDKNCMELKEFIEFCDWVDDIDVQFHVAALFAGRVGLRRSELAGLKYGDIDLKKKTLQLHSGRLPKGYTSKLKNKYSGQVIALPDTVIFFYNFYMQPKIHQSKDFVFWDKEKNEPKSVYWFSDMAKKYTKMFFKEKYNQDRYITIHGFRHTFASYIVNSGYSIKAAQAMLRHGDINSTQIYLHPEAEATKKTTRELDDYITEKWEKEWMPEERRKALEEEGN